MAHINVLDQSTINQIAAGEVIERPASVVKELLENAIDAQATAVTVETRDGGISFIRVTDNGCGIAKEEIALAFLRHSTSKIRSVEDLMTVSSLGFRGEALSSIAAVSQVEIITKTCDGITGSRYQIEGGREKSLEDIGAPEGTTFIARNLFFNTPARKKFLKTAQTEGAHVADLVEKIALSHPEISIRLIQNNQNKLHTSGNHNLKDIIYTVFGREIASNLLPVEAGDESVSLHGFIGRPVIARSNRNYENYYINGRYIKSNIISKAIEDAYKPFMMQHRYPFTMLHFAVEAKLLDVNVHPTKMELRFSDGELIYRLVSESLKSALTKRELIPEVVLEREERALPVNTKNTGAPEPFEKKRMESLHIAPAKLEPAKSKDGKSAAQSSLRPSAGRPDFQPAYRTLYEAEPASPSQIREDVPKWESAAPARLRPVKSEKDGVKNGDVEAKTAAADQSGDEKALQNSPEQMDLFGERLLSPKARSKHKLIGQLFDTYWLVEFSDSLYIIDQHAAHEKVLYEETMASLKDKQYTCQAVSPPIILTLSAGEELVLKGHMEYFTGIGFEIEPFGGKEYAVRGVPGNLFSIAKKELLMEMIDGLSDEGADAKPDMVYERVASMSCKAAVKGNHRMSALEANELIDRLLGLENPYACPHGRPTIISMSKYELEKKFKRVL